MPTDTSPSATASIVRCQVVEQHGVLRELLRRVHDVATQVLQHEGHQGEPLAELVSELRAQLLSHLAFEERALQPLLGNADAADAGRALRLREEHARQREEINTLSEGAAWEPDRLAWAARSLVTDLLRDMDDEERSRVGGDASCVGRDEVEALDDVVNVDRATD
jgi:iron-sulfur cluster repair protein YtfE (RIC family)